MNNDIVQDDVKLGSGAITLRMPKSLYLSLVAHAKAEGVSLNQFCIYRLAETVKLPYFNKKQVNKNLLDIRNNYILSQNLELLVDEIKALNQKIINLKPQICSILNNLSGKIKQQEIEDLENMFPIMYYPMHGSLQPFLKVPTFKLIISMDTLEKYGQLEEILKLKGHNEISYAMGYFDELLDHIVAITEFKENLSTYKQRFCLNFIAKDLDRNIELLFEKKSILDSNQIEYQIEPSYSYIFLYA